MLDNFKKYSGWIFLGTILLIIHKLIENHAWILEQVTKLKVILTPFIWAFIITYFLLALMRMLEARFKIKRLWAFILTYLLFFGMIGLFVLMVAPVIVENITDITEVAPSYITKIQSFMDSAADRLKLIEDPQIQQYFKGSTTDVSKWMLDLVNAIFNSVLNGVIGLTSWLFNFVFGIIISMYILYDVEGFEKAGQKFILALYGKERSSDILEFLSMSDQIFKDYFVGKVIDSAIVGVLCYVGLALLGAPYAMLMSLIVGIFNMIPYVGPVLGMIPAVIITLMTSPIKALWVAIFILVLQQIDGNIIGPKVLSDKVGVSPFGVVLAIAIGGGYFGIMGMLVSVPIYKVISIVIDRALDKKIILNKSN
ncbi:MAG: AI-2E family transporter [Peptostreptococcaceae bacterium]|nr:AI-2E family transporter [Peptostreptococcaceae bacterium]